MKKLNTELLSEVRRLTNQHILIAENLKSLSDIQLNTRTAPEKWTILKCVEHLNRYGNFYIPEIQRKVNLSTTLPNEFYKSTILGNWFANQMQVSPKIKTMKTAKSMDSFGKNLNRKTIDEFISQQNKILEILASTDCKNLNRIKIKTTILPLVTINLGDALRFVTNHNQRHFIQIQNICAKV